MRGTRAFVGVIVFASILSTTPALAQIDAPGQPPAPAARGTVGGMIAIGPKDNTDRPQEVRGKARIVCRTPSGVSPALVDILIDNKPIGSATKKRVFFTMDYDSATLTEGEHIVKGVGKDGGGREIWSASTKINVANSKPVTPRSNVDKPALPNPNLPEANNEPRTPAQPEERQKPFNNKANGKKIAPLLNPPANGSSAQLENELKNEAKGFSVRYPASWTVKDETAKLKPAVPGGWWILMGSAPVDKAPIVVNIRRRQLEPGSDENTFAKYESYILKWDKKTVQGAPAFATVTGTPKSKRVIHRLIVVKDSVVWMLNCIDTTGKPAAESGKLFDTIVNSMQLSAVAEPTVTIRKSP